MRVYRDVEENGTIVAKPIFDIIECTYSGKFMGERSITTTINWASPIDFQIGDYMDVQMMDISRGVDKSGKGIIKERFYIYVAPTIKKTASSGTHGKGFEHTVTFYPAQYELGCVQMRDLGSNINANNVIFTGFDNVTFYGGAAELMSRIMSVLAEVYKDSNGNPLWSCQIHPSVNEIQNPALERFAFTFSGNTVMDALLKLSDKDGINTTFFINNRTIYVGFERAYFCRVNDQGFIDSDPNTQMFSFKYGKTSHKSIALPHGGLYEITKSIGNEIPITKLYVYGGSRNLNRYYCSDRIKAGRYVNRLMLPSFSNDGKTDFIMSSEVSKYGIKEGTKHLEDIYPSLRYVTYGDIRQIKYCIKVEPSGLIGDNVENSAYPVARVQCYRVVESDTIGVNTLVKAAPQDDLAIFVHALGKTVKVVLYGGKDDSEALQKQLNSDGKVPTTDGKSPNLSDLSNVIPGSCFLVHNRIFDNSDTEYANSDRVSWFDNVDDEQIASKYDDNQKSEIELNQINYTDTFWLTDLYVFTSPHQTYFNRVGYSAWAYPKLNSNYTSEAGHTAHNSVNVNEIVLVEPVVIEDTSANIVGVDDDRNQQTFDLYLRDVGFKIDEQNAFGEYVFIVADTLKVSILDGNLTGQEFEVPREHCICAFNEDGSLNEKFFEDSGYSGRSIPEQAFDNGAIWRLTCKRTNLEEPDYANLNISLPNTLINANAGDHIVLLDIFMPDIYVQAAENRLLREGRKCLRSLDKGKTSYAVNFDKVRMQQIPNYALQMREGLNIRMEDDDLDICTVNRQSTLFDGMLVNNTSMYETTYDSKPSVGYYYTIEHRDFYALKDELLKFITINGDSEYIRDVPGTLYFKLDVLPDENGFSYGSDEWKGTLYGTLTEEDYNSKNELFAKDGKMNVRILSRELTENGTFYKLTDSYITVNVTNLKRNTNSRSFNANFTYTIPYGITAFKSYIDGDQRVLYGVIEYDMRIEHSFDTTEYTPNTHLVPSGSLVYAPFKTLIEFVSGKHYEVVIEASNTELLKTYQDGRPKFVLMNGLSGDSLMFEPITAVMLEGMNNGCVRYTFIFDLNSSFNDSIDYYPSLVYVSDNKTESVSTILISVVESDLEGNKDLNYADFTLQEVTIKITDSSNRTYAQPIKEISATLSEQHNASTWATLMNQVEKNAIEGESNNKLIETYANTARRHYQSLLNLRDHIFDPDGSIEQTFLQIMMLQVGADSMNYELDKTRTGFNTNGDVVLSGCSFGKGDDDKYHFKVGVENMLYHFVYSSNGGDWSVKSSEDFVLDAEDENGHAMPYFVCIKCKRLTNEAEWICDTIQHKVNEDDEYWYFNWGIIVPDSAGVYALTETRGNAYMYGDNLVCGKISDLAKRCYFDLTNGEFALGMNDDGTAALSYIDGVLTIGGLPNEKDIDDILERLGAVEQMEICGENLCIFDKGQFISDVKFDTEGYNISYETLTYNYLDNYGNIAYSYLKAGKYIFSAERMYFYILGSNGAPSSSNKIELKLQAITSDGNIHREVAIENGLHIQIKIETEVECYFRIKQYYTFNSSERLTINMLGVMLQHGTKATSYQPYLKNIADVLKGSTEIAGGLVMTNVLMLKNINGKVTAGISGITEEDENVLLWGGGTYKEAEYASKNDYAKDTTGDKMPVLLKKDGTGKMGCFEIVNENTISVNSADGNSKIIISAGKNAQDTNIVIKQNDEVKVVVSGDVIDRNSVSAIELIGNYSSGEKIKSPTQNIVVKNLNLQEGTGAWTAHFEADKIQVLFCQGVNSNIRQVRGYVDIYLCGKNILSTNLWTSDYMSSSSLGNIFGFVGNITRFFTTNSSQQTLEVRIRQMEVYINGEWGSDYRDQLSLSSVRFCTQLSDSTYEDKKVILSNVSSSDIVQVGRNGVQVSHANGGFIQMLNDNKDLYVRMVGLPTTIPTGDDKDGMLYNWNGFLRVGGNSVSSADFTELGYNRFVLPRHIIIPNMEKHNSGIYEQNELNAFNDGDVFINI